MLATLPGPGGPILIITSATNPFSSYTAEILQAEGLNEYSTFDITSVSSTMLNSYDVVIVGDIPLTDAQVTMLSNWANAGGMLITFSPDTKLASLLGINPTGSTMANKYILVNTATGPGKGIVNQTIQYQGTADLYTLNGATSLATLYSGATTATSNPAVTMRTVGTGTVVAFTYDLARSVVYIRQGNPAWAGTERDGEAGPIRSDDQYFPDWMNLSKVAIPAADEQQRLLVNIILENSRKPLPRFWFLPRGLKAVVVMTGDDHGNGGTKARFDQYMQKSADNSAEAVADWRAIRGSSYVFPGTPITDAQARTYEQQGFEIGLHVNTDCANYTAASLEQNLTTQLAQFKSIFPSVTAPVTNRTHCIAWSDWHTQAKLEVPKGIRLDANYYYWPAKWVQNRPGMFSGSGMPMRFAELNGTIIDCYQLVTQMTDESDQAFPFTVDQLLDRALGPEGYYGAFCANMHTDFNPSDGSDKIIASAIARNVPVISAKQLLTWLDGRNGSSFGAMSWNGEKLNFSISVASGARSLQGMLPITDKTGQLEGLTVNGTAVSYRIEKIKGIDYALFNCTPGNYVADYNSTSPPNQSPIVALTAPTNGAIFNAPASITITANASDTGGSISKVDFYSGTTLLGTDTSSPYSFTWSNVAAGTYSLIAKATDNGGATTASTSVNVTVNGVCPCTVFQPSEAPSGSAYNDGSQIVVGMKFRASINGSATGVRFYKQTNNTGTHTGQLYNSTGTLLAQATFINETASGWQEVNFSSPVTITANTTYIVAYHSVNGFYGGTNSYFGSTIDRPPLRALGSSEEAGNGVYAYGSGFPNQTFGASNYWVDVVFNNGAPPSNPAPTVAITSPANGATFTAPASITINANAADTSPGTVSKVDFYNGTTLLGTDVSSPYSFAWSNVAAGTYSLTARATDNGGTTTTSAVVSITVNGVANQPPTVSITSPANGATFTAPASITINANAADTSPGTVSKVDFYNGTTLLGTDVSSPYSFAWSNVAAGTYSLTARATDNGGTTTTSAAVSITVNGSNPPSTCPCTVFRPTDVPGGTIQNDGQSVQLGMKFRSSVNGNVTAVRFYKQTGNTGTHIGQLYSSTGTLLAQATFINETASGWQEVNFSSPVSITANTTYVITYHSSEGHYSVNDFGFTSSIVNGPLTGLQNGFDGRNGVYLYTATPAYPTENYEASNYYVDAVFNTVSSAASTASRLNIATPEVGAQVKLTQAEGMMVYPNPVTHKAKVQFVLVEGGAYTLDLYDAQGRLVKVLRQGKVNAGELNIIEVDGAKLAKGLYLVRLQTNTGAQTAKLLLDR
ncbi:DUF4082 domain-containing protein [Adhaeribacter radiodurans]|uniref:DUF4082 domain-containing protein n=1 Tax=Adhaeribacter radiodurans TaxID=2745197 RepID=A0A7L7LDV0_9BACT|nr:DUF4082 domain-containing protein [Adhaeribacter radiodurans]QMU31022.1 DUF4082 domain-containing protein [Adhaeribacter radiodurans]